ncbi:hypothetical protein AVEN_133359-1 [Araneus ventricosus]|uniref:Tc1-like transposase DDE domain-containing protein n=1 Tax=Araneus ventricosus TaxID=182803 RepID=A0A4Y2DLN4_ARAVE|nr:hypothetical protein AVEN_133359-1 [Araneus ventricosus]
MKAANYLNIIANQLHLNMVFVFPTGNRSFQQDNAPCHKARIVLEWFERILMNSTECPGHLIPRILIRWSTFGMWRKDSLELKHHHVEYLDFA